MNSGAKLLGHHIHPILIVFPLGLLGAGTIFDIAHLIRGGESLAWAAYWMIAAGIIGGLAAAVFGLVDWLAIAPDTRAKRIGLIHGLVNVVVVATFAFSWYLRMDNPAHPPMNSAFVSLAGAVISMFGGWLGGELVERLGIGVDPGANANAPSSLSQPSLRVHEEHPKM